MLFILAGIVYTLSRRNAEDVCAGLCGAGIAAGCYHTDRLPQDKTKTHRQWLEGSVQVRDKDKLAVWNGSNTKIYHGSVMI